MKSVIIGKYKLFLIENPERLCDYRITNLAEAMCIKMVTVMDAGERYSNDSRYTYHTEYDNKDDMQCGTAKAAVQRVIIEKLNPKSLNEFVRIENF